MDELNLLFVFHGASSNKFFNIDEGKNISIKDVINLGNLQK